MFLEIRIRMKNLNNRIKLEIILNFNLFNVHTVHRTLNIFIFKRRKKNRLIRQNILLF